MLAQYYHTPWMATRSLMWDEWAKSAPRVLPNWMAEENHPNTLGHRHALGTVYRGGARAGAGRGHLRGAREAGERARQPRPVRCSCVLPCPTFPALLPCHQCTAMHCRHMADMIITLLRHTLEDLALRPFSQDDEERARAPLPHPMYDDNYPPTHNMCMMGGEFQAAVVQGASTGFEWVNEGSTEKPKWGWVATTPGSALQFELDTRMGGGAPTADQVSGGQACLLERDGRAMVSRARRPHPLTPSPVLPPRGQRKPLDVYASIAYLMSYEHMGVASEWRAASHVMRDGSSKQRGFWHALPHAPPQLEPRPVPSHAHTADVTCVSGCACDGFQINAHHPDQHSSQTMLDSGAVTQAAACRMQLTVMQQTTSGEHKFKVVGAIVAGVRWHDLSNNGKLRSEFGSGGELAQAHD